MKITVGDYLLKRLKEIGINHVFGVPGDYNLGFLDQVEDYNGLKWVGNCNELNASYAADGYARTHGASAIVTTFGVGELSAINGIAGAYAEYVPVINIVGMPSTVSQKNKALLHHSLGEGDFNVFADMFAKMTSAQTVLNPFNASREIDRVLKVCMTEKRPVYIGIPTDVSFKEIDDNAETLQLSHTPSDRGAVTEAVTRVSRVIMKAQKPVILVDIGAARHPRMKELIYSMVRSTGIPCAAMPMGKSVLNERCEYYLGMYNGDIGTPGVKERVEESDCIISFGAIFSDFNTGGFTSQVRKEHHIEVQADHVCLRHSLYESVNYEDFIGELIHNLEGYRHNENIQRLEETPYTACNEPISHHRLWRRIENFIKPNSVVVAEAGTSLFGLLNRTLPDNTTFVSQPLWASIGYSVGSLLGTCMADQTRENVLFVGDGSFQLSAQELSTMLRNDLKPIVFLLNNDGYTVERLIHGEHRVYNDIQMWDYTAFAKSLGKDIYTCKVRTENELENALEQLDKHTDKLRFVEICLDQMDTPKILAEIGRKAAKANKYH